MVEAKNIVKSYDDLEVLKDVSLLLPKSKIATIIGKSGAGKSTLLHILGTLDDPDSGEIFINGNNTADFNEKQLANFRNQEIGFIFQFHHLLKEFTALENVMIPGMVLKRDHHEVEKDAKKLLSYLGLSSRVTHKPNELSGGEAQRVAVARALINKPAVVFADEPTGNLDTASSDEMHKLFIQLRDDFGHTFLIATHNMELASMSDLKFQLIDGKMAT